MDQTPIGRQPLTRIAVVNCNTNAVLTEALRRIAEGAARPGTQIGALTPPFGPESAEGYYESFVSAAAMLAALEEVSVSAGGELPYDAVVLAGFGEHGREGVRQRWEVPVVDITEAGPVYANLLAHRYGVVTTLSSTVPAIWESLHSAGLSARCIGVEASEIPVSSIHADVEEVASALEKRARELLGRGAEAIVLGCAGFAGLDVELQVRLGVPVVDGVVGAVQLAESLAHSGFRTSKTGAFRPINREKTWKGWPPVGAES